ncbi:MAG: pilin [Patescibacteria group bacterium]
MKNLGKFTAVFVVVFLMLQFGTATAFALEEGVDESDSGAEDATVLPSTMASTADCKKMMNYVNTHAGDIKEAFAANDDSWIDMGSSGLTTVQDILGCGIKTGDIKLWMIPYYIRYVLEFIIQIGGLAAVGGIMYGGYLYLFAGISEDKDKGKKAILYGVVGMILTLVAWALVNIVIAVLTG